MKVSALIATVMIGAASCGAPAQVPDSGRWQELHFAAADVRVQAALRFQAMQAELVARGQLDDDAATLARVRAVATGLVTAAIALKPEAAGWAWEFHTTSAPDVEALCMDGGKILIGSAFVRALTLDDAELATLLGHEVAHAVAEHQRETLSEALFINAPPGNSLEVTIERLDTNWEVQLRLATLSYIQESEADQLGMVIAHRAGWPGRGMVSLYRKLAAIERPGIFNGNHPSGRSRLSMATGMAVLFRH
ncbi:MAG: M48 family metalloprotease [Pseudomonadota bacterium]